MPLLTIVLIVHIVLVIVLFSKQGEMRLQIKLLQADVESLRDRIKGLAGFEAPKEEVVVDEPVCDELPVRVMPPVVEEREETSEATYGLAEEEKAVNLLFRSENWVGVNLLNRLGALLIVIGAIATASYEGFPAIVRSFILFAFAFCVTSVGEFMNRRKPTTASIGVSAVGVALIYVAIAASYFGLETMGMYTALFSCIAATALGVFLAVRYESQVIGCFALIGGYLPIFALDPLNKPVLIGLIVYFILLSMNSLVLALARKWSAMNILGFGLTVVGTSYISWQADATTALWYACFAFLLYTALPLIAAYRTGERFRQLDVALVTLNTFVSSIVIFLIADELHIEHLHAYLCLAFGMIYIGLAGVAKWVFGFPPGVVEPQSNAGELSIGSPSLEKNPLDDEARTGTKNMQTIFTLTAIAFGVLFVPFYFEQKWFAVAWIVEAVVLACYGVLANKKVAEYSGLGILGIAAITLFAHDVVISQFTFKYAFFTIGALVVFGAYIARNRQFVGYEQGYKFMAFANLWAFTMYVLFKYITNYDDVGTLCVLATFILAVIYAKPVFWADNGTRGLANFMHGVGILGLWATNFIYAGDHNNGGLMFNLLVTIIGFAMILYYNSTEGKTGWRNTYKNVNIINLWLSLLWILGSIFQDVVGIQPMLMIFTLASAMVITRIREISDGGTRGIAIFMHVVGLLWLWVYSLEVIDLFGELFLIGVTQVVALVALNDLIRLYREGRTTPFKLVILSGYFLLVVTQGLMVQADMAFNSAIISILFAVASFAWILLGFYLRNKSVRKFGLILSMVSVFKLMVIDTMGLSTEMRIVSYISLGLILMLISFVYQKLSRD